MSDDDFVDVAATVASSSSVHGSGGVGDGNDAFRALSGRLGDDDGAVMSASTSSQHQTLPPAASPQHSSRRGWFSSLFGGGGAFPAAVEAARSKTVRAREEELEELVGEI